MSFGLPAGVRWLWIASRLNERRKSQYQQALVFLQLLTSSVFTGEAAPVLKHESLILAQNQRWRRA